MKACILAAGSGQRLHPLTESRPKPLIPIGGKVLLEHTLDHLKENNVTDILLIVGYLKEQIQDYFGNGTERGLNIEYVEQKEFLGTGHAANLAKEFTKEDPFLLIYGDLFMDRDIITKAIDTYNTNKETCAGVITALEVKDPTKYGILNVSDEMILKEIQEKPPDERFGNLANAGIYIFSPSIFPCIDATQKSPRGEYELTDSIEISISKKLDFKVLNISSMYWNDVGHPWQFLETNHQYLYLLNKISQGNIWDRHLTEFTLEDNIQIHGHINLGKGTIIKSGTYIEGPVIIGENSVIGPNAYIRPYTVIGNNVKIGNSSEIKNSIIMNNSAVPHLSYVGDSIIGEKVNLGCGTVTANVRLDKADISMNIKGNKVNTHRRKLGAIIGDNVSLGINVSIMPGKKIGSNSQIGSNSIVNEDVEPSTLYYTNPKVMKKPIE